jgi:hypothetical protein
VALCDESSSVVRQLQRLVDQLDVLRRQEEARRGEAEAPSRARSPKTEARRPTRRE